MTLFVLAALPIITSLTFMGYNFIVIRLGLMTLNYTIFKILNILDKLMIRMDKLDIMKAVVVLGKLLLITSILTLISLEVAMIGAVSPFIILASLSMIPLYFCVMMMISILKYASKKGSVVIQGSLVLDIMTEAFAGLMELIGSLVGAMMGIEIAGTISAISSLILILGLLVLMPMALSLVKTQVSIGLFSMISLCVGIILFAGMIVLISSIVEGVKFSTIAIFVGQVILLVAAFTALGFASQFLIPLLTPLLIVAVEIFAVVALLAKAIDIA